MKDIRPFTGQHNYKYLNTLNRDQKKFTHPELPKKTHTNTNLLYTTKYKY
jgi:hypothetical protein